MVNANQPDMKRFMVIGGTGVIGHFVTRRLVDEGYSPVVITVSGNTGLIKDILDKVTVVKANIVDAEMLNAVFAEHLPTHLVHMGANIGVEQRPSYSAQVYVEGMANVLEAARISEVQRMVFTSTKGVYGPVYGEFSHPTYRPLHENMMPQPATMRGSYKLASEHMGRIYRKRHGIEFTAVRFSSTIGPAKTQRHDETSVHSKMIENAMLGLPAVIAKGGDALTDIIYNDDAARGIMAVLHAEGPTDVLYNIGSGYGITLAEFGEGVQTVYPNAEFEIGPGTQYLNPETSGHCILNGTRAREDLGFEVSYTPATMVAAYVEMMERMGIDPIAT